jgi:palmitoyltransferase
MKMFGLLLSVLAVVLISFIGIFFFYAIIPLVTPGPSIGFFWHYGAGTWVLFCIYFNFIMCSWTNPGNPPAEWLEKVSKDIEELRKDQETVKGKSWSKYCRQCKDAKPPRAHHCHICDKCVSRMDHHCPWVNNCVGFKNHRYFVSFLFYLWFACIYIGVMMSLVLFGWVAVDNSIYYAWQHIISFVAILCIAIGITMTGFYGWHMYLILTNQTTIEFQFNKLGAWTSRTSSRLNEYDLGWRKNLEQIFGKMPLWRMFIPSLQELPLDGSYYPSIHDGDKWEQFAQII